MPTCTARSEAMWLHCHFAKQISVTVGLEGFIQKMQRVHHTPVFTVMVEFPERLEWDVHLCKLHGHQQLQSMACESSKPVRISCFHGTEHAHLFTRVYLVLVLSKVLLYSCSVARSCKFCSNAGHGYMEEVRFFGLYTGQRCRRQQAALDRSHLCAVCRRTAQGQTPSRGQPIQPAVRRLT